MVITLRIEPVGNVSPSSQAGLESRRISEEGLDLPPKLRPFRNNLGRYGKVDAVLGVAVCLGRGFAEYGDN